MAFKNYLTEAILINHPERGIEIRPDGGMGSWTIERLVKDTRAQLLEISKKIKHEDFAGAEYILFKNGAFKAKISALATYDKFKIKQGKRPIAVGKEIDLGESEMKYQALAMAKELHTALAELTFIEMLSVMDPNNPAKKEVQELETAINKLTTDVGEFIQKYIPDVADAETADIDELPDEEDAKDKIKPKAISKDKKKQIKENQMVTFKEFLQESDNITKYVTEFEKLLMQKNNKYIVKSGKNGEKTVVITRDPSNKNYNESILIDLLDKVGFDTTTSNTMAHKKDKNIIAKYSYKSNNADELSTDTVKFYIK